MQLFYNIYDKVQQKFFYLVFILASFSLSFAYFVEYILGFKPCVLCIYQRLPYYVIAFCSIIAIVQNRFRILIAFLITISFTLSFGLALYHTGIEHKIFPPTSQCHNQLELPSYESFGELENSLLNMKPVSCDKAHFYILGFTMAELNVILSFIMLALSLFATYREINNKMIYEK